VRNVPPPPIPAASLPALNVRAPRLDGAQPVVLDVVGRAAQVEDIDRLDLQVEHDVARIAPARSSRLCITPCEVNLAPGAHLLRFTDSTAPGDASSYASVQVGQEPLIFRYAEGEYRTYPTLQGTATGLMATGIPIGVLSVAPLLLGTFLSVNDSGVTDALKTTGLVGIGIGVTLVAAAIVLKVIGQDTYQPGSANQWSVAPPAPSPKRATASELPPPPPPPAAPTPPLEVSPVLAIDGGLPSTWGVPNGGP
jgi:hypothetical protein